VADGTAVRRDVVLERMRALVPSVAVPSVDDLPATRRMDFGPDAARGVPRWPIVYGEPYDALVSDIDEDGNEVAGVRLPEAAAPTTTATGWNPRRPVAGLPDVLYEFCGTVLPFPRTAAEAEAADDRRRPLDARYPDRDAYEKVARAAADELVAQRLLLREDVERAVRAAVRSYQRVMAPPG
jgi:hypothetical protein